MADPVKVLHPVSGKRKLIAPRAVDSYLARGFVLEELELEELEAEPETAPEPETSDPVRPRRRSQTKESADDGAEQEQTE